MGLERSILEVLSHPFPMIRGGGLFLISVGFGFLIGWIFPRIWTTLAITGFVVGFVSSSLSGLIPPSLGVPTNLQIVALVIAIVVEIVLINLVIKYTKDERERILWILFVVGSHFIIMGISFGPMIMGLGLMTMLNAWIGLKVFPATRLEIFGWIDSLLKVGLGMWMFLFYPDWKFPL